VRLIAPFGFYGWGNIGDEATLRGFGRLVGLYERRLRVWVASRNPAHTGRVEPSFRYFRAEGRDVRRWWAHRSARGYVMPGGTPVMDVLGAWPLSEVAPLVETARLESRPIVFVGTGTERLERTDSRVVVARRLAPHARHWTVRSERDRERLVEYGVPAERVSVAADLAWLLDPAPLAEGLTCLEQAGVPVDGPIVGVNVTNERFLARREPDLLEKMAAALDTLVDKCDARVVFLCNEVRGGETFDRAASEKVRAHMRRGDRSWLIPNQYRTPEAMMSVIGCCRLAIGMRYHFCLFAAVQGVPFVAIKRSDKVSDLCWDMDWPYGASVGGVDVPQVVEMAVELLNERGARESGLADRVRRLRERARRNTVALDALVEAIHGGSRE
jgi:polysaccharide pyruvyl transferase WcaK-like protein